MTICLYLPNRPRPIVIRLFRKKPEDFLAKKRAERAALKDARRAVAAIWAGRGCA